MLLAAAVAVAHAQPAPPTGEPAPAFSIGYLTDGSDFQNAPVLMERLRRHLMADAGVVAALTEAGYSTEIELSPCDGPQDMIQRMEHNEFDIAFTTAVVFARQNGDYVPILTTYRTGDLRTGRDGGVLRRGVVFAGPASDLFHLNGEPTDEQLRAALARSPLAVPSSYSAAGYIYPTLTMRQSMGLSGPAGYWFAGSDGEVVKNVIAGLAPLGACRDGEIEALLAAQNVPGSVDQYVRILFRTDQFPTDQIVVRADLTPERSELGRDLKVAVRMFFQSPTLGVRGLAVENAGAPVYDKLRRDLGTFAEYDRRDATSVRPRPIEQLQPILGPETAPATGDAPTTASAAEPAAERTPAPTPPTGVRPILPPTLPIQPPGDGATP